MFKDVMLDFETLGNGKDKCLCQVGAIYFDSATGELGSSYKANIDASTHQQHGGVIDANTVYWWLSQDKKAQESLLQDKKPIAQIMIELHEFLQPASRIWSHATFDFVTLMETFRQLNITNKISYKSGLDLRTLVYLAGTSTSEFPREGVHHDALDDCKHQVKYCVAALNQIKTNKNLIRFLGRIQAE